MSSYVRGRAYEYRVKHKLEKLGWTVFRCAGSKPLDLIALKKEGGELRVRLIECKMGSSKIRARDREKFKEVKEKLGITVEAL